MKESKSKNTKIINKKVCNWYRKSGKLIFKLQKDIYFLEAQKIDLFNVFMIFFTFRITFFEKSNNIIIMLGSLSEFLNINDRQYTD